MEKEETKPGILEAEVPDSKPLPKVSSNSGFEQVLQEFFLAPDEQGEEPEVFDVYRGELVLQQGEDKIQEYLSFRLANENFAVSILEVKEIIKLPLITMVPRINPVILGILSLRGLVVPVIDLRKRLGLAVSPQDRKSRILIVQTVHDLVGLLIDEVRQVIRLQEKDIEPPPSVFGRQELEHMVGVGRYEGEMFTLLNLAAVVQIQSSRNKRSEGVSGA
jgi:chemotaxis signal transduction protein